MIATKIEPGAVFGMTVRQLLSFIDPYTLVCVEDKQGRVLGNGSAEDVAVNLQNMPVQHTKCAVYYPTKSNQPKAMMVITVANAEVYA